MNKNCLLGIIFKVPLVLSGLGRYKTQGVMFSGMLTNYVTGLMLANEVNRGCKGCASSSAVIYPEL